MTFFTSQARLARAFQSGARQAAFTGESVAQAQQWQADSRALLSKLLGLERMESCAPAAQLRSTQTSDGIVREEWLLQTEPDVWMPFTLLLPQSTLEDNSESTRQSTLSESPRAAVICPHGHASGGRAMTSGARDNLLVTKAIEDFNGDYGLQLARAGFVVACPDARGFGERRENAVQETSDQDESRILESSCHHLTLASTPLGFTVQGMWTWDLMRLLDFLAADARIDAQHIGCAGLSGGGLQTLNLAALDTRIQAAVVSGYFYGAQASLLEQNANCQCNMVHGLWNAFDMGDIAALFAPRALLVETGDADPLNGAPGLENVFPQIEIARRAFDLRGGVLEHHVFKGGHRWNGERAIPWMQNQLATAL